MSLLKVQLVIIQLNCDFWPGLGMLCWGGGTFATQSVCSRFILPLQDTIPIVFKRSTSWLASVVKAVAPSNCIPKQHEISYSPEALTTIAVHKPAVHKPTEGGLLQKGLAKAGVALVTAIEKSKKLSAEQDRKQRRDMLTGIWEPVNFADQWFMFTHDLAMLRSDGLATKFRWNGEECIELYVDDCDKTIAFSLLSLGKNELLLKIGDQSGHFRKGVTISEEEREKHEAEMRRRRAEASQNFRNYAVGVSSLLAAGGFAILCTGAAVGLAGAGGRGGGGSGGGSGLGTGLTKTCSKCGMNVPYAARQCPYCGNDRTSGGSGRPWEPGYDA